MYRAILIDDEERVLNGLKNYVDWGKHNIKIVGTFENGRDAYAYLCKNEVDLIVTDVCTPYMDGIELAKRARAREPKVKILFISGYSDVQYLRDALKLEAVDYIFKSIDLDELDAALSRVCGIIAKEIARELHFSEMEERFQRNLPVLRNSRLTMLLRDNIDETVETPTDMERELHFLGISLDNRTHYAVMVVRLQNKWSILGSMTERERWLFGEKVVSTFETELAKYGSGVCFRDRPAEYILIINAEEEDCETILLSVAEAIQAQLYKVFGLETMIGISDRFSGLNKIRIAYKSACEAIQKRYFIEDNLAISINKYVETGNLSMMQENAEQEIGSAITSGNMKSVKHSMERALLDMRMLKTVEEQQNFMLFLLFLPTNLLTKVDISQKGSYANQRVLLERYLMCKTPEDQAALLWQSYEEVTSILADMSVPKPSAVIQRVTDLISQRYMEHLSVSMLASAVYLSPTYLCVLFKQQTSQTINEYITLERIKQAKRLLADTSILLYDVCYKVGYLSPSYFSKLFKKHTGQTPGEYREGLCPARKDA